MAYILFVILAVFCACPVALFGMDLEQVFIVSTINDAEAATQKPKFALEGDKVELFCVVKASIDGKVAYFTTAGKVKGIASKNIGTWDEHACGDITIEWFKVEPYMKHEELEGNDPEAPWFTWYANAHVPGTPSHPKWIGHDTVEYGEHKIKKAKGKWSILADAHPTDSGYDVNDGLGAMRYKVEVTYKGKALSSPGMESLGFYGISKDVHMVNFRKDNTFPGWLTSYFNVPGIYGSSKVQVKNYVGVDCSDLLTAAYMKATGRKLTYTSANGLLKDVNAIEKFQYLFDDGSFFDTHEKSGDPNVITFGSDGIKEGDLIWFCYDPVHEKKKCKRWHHVGAVYKDSGPKGKPDKKLNRYDLILHAGPLEPHLSTLDSEGFVDEDPTAVVIGRWK